MKTANLVEYLFIEGRKNEILDIVSDKIDAEDMSNKILAIYALLELDAGNSKNAKLYFERALENGFISGRFDNLGEPLRTKSLDKLEQLIEFERGD